MLGGGIRKTLAPAVDEKMSADAGPRVNVDAGAGMSPFRHHARNDGAPSR